MSALPHMTPILNYSQVHTYKGCRSKPMLRFPQKDCTRAKYSLRVFIIPIITLVCLTFQTLLNEGQLLAEYDYEMTWGHIQHTGPCIFFFSRILLHWCPDARCQWANWWQSKTEQKKGKEKDVFFWKKSFRPDHREKRDGNVKTQRFHSEEYFTLNLSWSKPSPVL